MDQKTLEVAEVSKDKVLQEEEELEEESENPPSQRICEQLEIEKPPLAHIDFVISDSISTSPFIYDYISLCGIGMKETIKEEHADQREGNFIHSLERRRLMLLWVFKENLKPD